MPEEKNENEIVRAEGIEMMNAGSASLPSLIPNIPTMLSLLGGIQKKQKIRDIRDIPGFLTFEVTGIANYDDAALAATHPVFYVANVRCFLLGAKMRHDTNSSSGTVDVEKLVDGTAKGSGVSMLESVFDTSTGARTTKSKKPSTTLANIVLNPGDTIALKAAGTLTGATYVVVTCLFGILTKDLPTTANI